MARKKVEDRFWEKVVRNGDCLEWQANRNNYGYGKFSYRGKDVLAHRFSWRLQRGQIPKGKHVLHKCDNPACVRPSHLFLGTNSENIKDRMKKGRSHRPVGEMHPMAKLTWDDVEEIRSLYSTGNYTQKAIGDRFGVTFQQISDIVNNRKWVR